MKSGGLEWSRRRCCCLVVVRSFITSDVTSCHFSHPSFHSPWKWHIRITRFYRANQLLMLLTTRTTTYNHDQSSKSWQTNSVINCTLALPRPLLALTPSTLLRTSFKHCKKPGSSFVKLTLGVIWLGLGIRNLICQLPPFFQIPRKGKQSWRLTYSYPLQARINVPARVVRSQWTWSIRRRNMASPLLSCPWLCPPGKEIWRKSRSAPTS